MGIKQTKMKIFLKIICVIFFTGTFNIAFSQQHVFSDEIKNFKAQDQQQMADNNAILFVGSSSFRMWTDVQDYFPGYKIINRGFGGSSLSDVIYYADDIIFPYQLRQVVIYCGENDLAEPNVDASVVYDRFKILFQLIRKHYPGIPVTYVSMKPSPGRKRNRPSMEAGNAAIRYYLSNQKNTSYVDVYHLMLNDLGNPKPEIFRSDSLHMNANGYAIWKKAIEPHLVK